MGSGVKECWLSFEHFIIMKYFSLILRTDDCKIASENILNTCKASKLGFSVCCARTFLSWNRVSLQASGSHVYGELRQTSGFGNHGSWHLSLRPGELSCRNWPLPKGCTWVLRCFRAPLFTGSWGKRQFLRLQPCVYMEHSFR